MFNENIICNTDIISEEPKNEVHNSFDWYLDEYVLKSKEPKVERLLQKREQLVEIILV